AAHAGAAGAGGIPGEAEAGREVVFIGEVRAERGAGVTGEDETEGGVGEDGGLLAGFEAEGAVLGVALGAAVFVAQAGGDGEVGEEVPLVLQEPVGGFLADIGGRIRPHAEEIRDAEEEIGDAGIADAGAAEAEVAIAQKIEGHVLLVGGEASAEFPGVASPDPGDRVGVGPGGAHQVARALDAEPEAQAVVEVQVGRSDGQVRGEAEAELGGGGEVGGGLVLQAVGTLDVEVELVQQVGREGPGVGESGEITVIGGGVRVAGDVGIGEGQEPSAAQAADGEAEFAAGAGSVIHLGGDLVVVVGGDAGGVEQAAGSVGIRLAAMNFAATGLILVGSMMACAWRAGLGWKKGLAARNAATPGSGVPLPSGLDLEKSPFSSAGVGTAVWF